MVPVERITACNGRDVNGAGEFIFYWMIAARRRHFNFGLQRAVEWASELRKPLLVVEALGGNYRWVSRRFHAFIQQGMADNLKAFKQSAVTYYPYVERCGAPSAGMAHALAARSCVTITDDFPAFDLPGWVDAVSSRAPALVEKVDSSCIVPFRTAQRTFKTAASFRRFLEREVPRRREEFPLEDPLNDIDLPRLRSLNFLRDRWPAATAKELEAADLGADCPQVDGTVGPVLSIRGGEAEALRRLKSFVRNGLKEYADKRKSLEDESQSGLSPYLHFGHISAHEIYEAARRSLPVSAPFLDQLTTWRELGFNMCARESNYDQYESLPQWAQDTLDEHRSDPRSVLYSQQEFEDASTHDALWNAAQIQLRTEGRIQNYLRMLWGKKILEWSATPRDALSVMIHLNNKYALDGRDPNSYSGIFWIFGRYDRPWGPKRPIFGTVRYMSSASTARKLKVSDYIDRYQRRLL
jgi:deoxyribodipyrimidine photo-lyase